MTGEAVSAILSGTMGVCSWCAGEGRRAKLIEMQGEFGIVLDWAEQTRPNCNGSGWAQVAA